MTENMDGRLPDSELPVEDKLGSISVTGKAAAHGFQGEMIESVAEGYQRTGRMSLYFRRFLRRPSATVGVVLLLILILFAVFGSAFSKWSYEELDFSSLSVPSNAEHWLGTTPGGSDLYAMVVRGVGRSMAIGFLSSTLMTIIAAIFGAGIAFFEGWVEKIGMWILDTLLVIPSFLLIAMLVRSVSGASGWLWLTIGLTAFGWINHARVLHSLTMSLREFDYVKAAKFMGVGSFTIILRHLVPNLGSVLVINTVLGVVGAINSETALSFLGLGIKAPDTSLGTLLNEGKDLAISAPWVLIYPSLILIVLTFSVQLVGDGIRDAIDPYSRSAGKAE